MSETHFPLTLLDLLAAGQMGHPDNLLGWEREENTADGFTALDALVGELVCCCLRGERLVSLTPREDRTALVTVHGVAAHSRTFVEKAFSVAEQQARGAWYLPETVPVKAGYTNLPYHFRFGGRFASTLVLDDKNKATLRTSADTVLVWALLEPLFAALFQPLILRGPDATAGKPKTSEEQVALWNQADEFYSDMGLDRGDAFAQMRYGGGWHQLRAGEQESVKRRLLASLAEQASPTIGARFRARCVLNLANVYLKKSKNGTVAVKRDQVVTKALERDLSGCFGGGWLDFLAYLHREPHADERVVTILPTTKLYVRGGDAKIAQVASQRGLPVDEVRRILGVAWENQTSPIEERIDLLLRYWAVFDQIHAQQSPGMKPLWGLVEDRRDCGLMLAVYGEAGKDAIRDGERPFHPGLYRDLLPPALLASIDRLWRGIILPAFPDKIVTETHPHFLMAETFGAALTFWHGSALTAWFLCEGPYSRTNMEGLAHYHRKHLAVLQEMGTPIDDRLFAELIAAEKQLGEPQPIRTEKLEERTVNGMTIAMTTTHGSRREGFERLRDIITVHRQRWAEQYLTAYVQYRWESQLREAARHYAVHLSDKNKPPTAKQFARTAHEAASQWFGGDLGALYAAIGERSLIVSQRVRLLPCDVNRFVLAVYQRLGGESVEPLAPTASQAMRSSHQRALSKQRSLVSLAEMAPTFIQLNEALGQPPRLSQWSRGRFEYLAPTLAPDVDQAFQVYVEVVARALNDSVPLASDAPPQFQVIVSPAKERLLEVKVPQESMSGSTKPTPFFVDETLPTGEERNTPSVTPPLSSTPPAAPKRSWLDRLLRRS